MNTAIEYGNPDLWLVLLMLAAGVVSSALLSETPINPRRLIGDVLRGVIVAIILWAYGAMGNISILNVITRRFIGCGMATHRQRNHRLCKTNYQPNFRREKRTMNYGLVSKQGAPVCRSRLRCDRAWQGECSCFLPGVETAAAETLLGDYKDPTPSSAGTGLTQLISVPSNGSAISTKTAVMPRYLNQFGIDLSRTVYAELRTSPLMAMLFCRLRYLAVSESIPATRDGPRSVLEKILQHPAGKGTPQDYIDKCQRAGVDALFTQ
ncbi:hypothetical protein [Klebsiella quasipneumoniae]|uniref:hypothetical protein n=1 Tax=Klebsiella quasipneumoniae TaxID=1463165 RepID=UPI0038905650